MFSEIKLSDNNFKEYELVPSTRELGALSKINILVGPNNSGKSRFLRKLFSHKLEYKISGFNSNELNTQMHKFYEEYESVVRRYGIDTNIVVGNARSEIKKIGDFSYLSENLNIWPITIEFIEKIKTHAEASIGNAWSELGHICRLYLNKIYPLLKGINEKEFNKYLKIYIPVLRGLRPLQSSSSNNDIFNYQADNYLYRCLKDYFTGLTIEKENIFTGLNLYDATKSLLLGKTEDREKIKSFEHFLSASFFQNQIVNIVPNVNDDVLHIRIGTDEYPIHQLGDGIQSLIILTYPLFFNKDKNLVVFIEEPETHLHPGFQRLFIETLQRKEFEKFQFYITTHSNHFLDLTIDFQNISVYSFRKDGGVFKIENINSGQHGVLELIGARNSSVFLSNCTIWVEGITDRIYLRKYLEVYMADKIKFREDYHYSFVEYGGNNITHWSFLDSADPNHPNINVERLCSRLFLITDNDGAGLTKEGKQNSKKQKKYERHLQLTEKLSERYYCLRVREIENLLTKATIKKTIQAIEKNAITLDFKTFDKKNHESELLGKFIESNVVGLKRKYEDKSGTIHDKVDFCKKAVTNINSIDDLSDHAKKLCQLIYDFITKNN